jgi:hypothetical protein
VAAPAAVESMTVLLAGAGLERGDAGVARELRVAAETLDRLAGPTALPLDGRLMLLSPQQRESYASGGP